MDEPLLGLGITELYCGRANEALKWIIKPIEFVFGFTGFEPDLTNWAYFIIANLYQGNVSEAVKYSEAFTNLRRRELHYAQWLTHCMADAQRASTEVERVIPHLRVTRERPSLHTFKRIPISVFRKNVLDMLQACEQPKITELIASISLPSGDGFE